MSETVYVAILSGAIGGLVTLIATFGGQALSRRFSRKDKKEEQEKENSAAQITSKDLWLNNLMQRVGYLETQLKEAQKNSESRERRIAELERDSEHCTATLAAIQAQNMELSTLRRYFERELRRSEILRAAYDSALLAIVMADNNGHIVSWNQAAVKLFGYQEWEVVGRPISMIMPEEYRDRHHLAFTRARETGVFRTIGKSLNFHGLTKDGVRVAIRLRINTWKVEGEDFFSATILGPDDVDIHDH